LLTPKPESIIENEYDKTKKILDLFFLVPAAYSGREIKLKIKFIDEPEPVSSAVCQNFNFEFGKTILNRIEVIKPKFEFKNFKQIFIEYPLFKKFMSLNREEEFEIFANVLFKTEKVKKLTTDFRDRVERVYEENIYGPPDDPDFDIEPYYDVLKLGDGQIALTLKDVI
jgi:hypothetical protein